MTANLPKTTGSIRGQLFVEYLAELTRAAEMGVAEWKAQDGRLGPCCAVAARVAAVLDESGLEVRVCSTGTHSMVVAGSDGRPWIIDWLQGLVLGPAPSRSGSGR